LVRLEKEKLKKVLKEIVEVMEEIVI